MYTSDELSQLKQLLKPSNLPLRVSSNRTTSCSTSTGFHDRNSNRQPGNVWSENEPFRIDLAAFKAFYSEVCLIPTSKSNRDDGSKSSQMTVRMGDTILVGFDGPRRFPMECNWGVAEVLVIFRDCTSKEELENCRKSTIDGHHDRYHIEIRWFYERKDIAMVANNSELEDSRELVEVFETDHVQTLEAGTSILASARLVDDVSSEISHSDPKAPVFLCKRFWSTQRGSLIPCSGLSGRKRRGLMYSKFLSPDECEVARNRISAIEVSHLDLGWKECMASVIEKLTLKDAARHAYGKGGALVGREGEIEKLITFFRSALRGDPGKGGVKSSMFLAGPPGVGKTACVRAAVARLQHEQSVGLLPKFRVIGLNGMELRHPFEAYVRFWEALTCRKHVGSYEKACEWLGTYFTSPSELSDQVDNAATILLVDEIDYLVTDKQTVLYDFFNWPKQAAGTAGGKRLIVVGISNTLNLAEQLMPSVRSRLDGEKCVFKAYSLQDTISILNAKLSEASPVSQRNFIHDVLSMRRKESEPPVPIPDSILQHFSFFEEDAILFAAKKTAALSGDIRRAFQICRAAAEIVTRNFERDKRTNQGLATQPYPKIRIGDVQKASQESFNMALVAAVSFSSSFEALLLISLAALRRTTGREVGGFGVQDILVKMEAIASASGDPEYSPPPAFGETLELINRLGEVRLKLSGHDHNLLMQALFVLTRITSASDLAADESCRGSHRYWNFVSNLSRRRFRNGVSFS
jgi:origin recognition complex subunit 1